MELRYRVLLTFLGAACNAAFSAVLATDNPPAADTHPEADRPAPAATVRQGGGHRCYDTGNRETVRLDLPVVDDEYGAAYDSPTLWVHRGSPCRDINVRSPRNVGGLADGQQACTLIKVMIGGGAPTGWVDVCDRWEDIVKFVPEGAPFVLRAAIRPVDVVVAT